MYPKTSACIYLALVVTIACVINVSTSAKIDQHRVDKKLTKLFDYEAYKKSFGKSYDSEAEESTRRCFFYARAMAAFVSGVNYKYRNRDHYLALNKMSDWLPAERAKIKNKHLRKLKEPGTQSKEHLLFKPAKGEKPEETLRKFLEERADNPVYKSLLDQLLDKPADSDDRHIIKQRRKRESGNESKLQSKPRDFSFDNLIHSKHHYKIEKRPVLVGGVNKKHAFLEPVTRGFSEQIREVDFTIYEDIDDDDEDGDESLSDQLESSLSSLNVDNKHSQDDDDNEDKMFVDHREGGCMNEIKNQGQCGSCYAFAATTIAEWLYCTRNSGKKVVFAEQYIVDCAKQRHIPEMNGCDGGTDYGSITFMETMGMELERDFPYMGRETVCPYDRHIDTDTAGYIKMEIGKAAIIPISMFDAFLEHMPLSLVIQTYDGFEDYGGGIDNGDECVKHFAKGREDFHAVVIVGSGRENGQDYWLIRNSYGTDWGENGYYKLLKSVPEECIISQDAYAYGTKDGVHYNARPRKNRHYHDETPAKKQVRSRAEVRERKQKLQKLMQQLEWSIND